MMLSGSAYPLPPSAHPTDANESSSSAGLLPTPNAEGGTGYMSGSKRDTWRPTLETAVRGYLPVLHQGRPDLVEAVHDQLFPTPDSEPDRHGINGCHTGGNPNLAKAVHDQLFPTPDALAVRHGTVATHMRGSPTLGKAAYELLSTPQARDYKGIPSDDYNLACLARDVALLPTPRATDGTKGGPNQRGSSGDLMLPSAVTHLPPTPMEALSSGASTSPPSAAGKPSSGGQLLLPWNPDETGLA
jgi:hypothetical protein